MILEEKHARRREGTRITLRPTSIRANRDSTLPPAADPDSFVDHAVLFLRACRKKPF